MFLKVKWYYIFGEESGSSYKITTVKDNWVTEEANFEQDKNDVFVLKSKVHYDFTNERYETLIESYDLGHGNVLTIKTDYKVYDVKTTTTTYDNSGKVTKTTEKKSSIEFEQ